MLIFRIPKMPLQDKIRLLRFFGPKSTIRLLLGYEKGTIIKGTKRVPPPPKKKKKIQITRPTPPKSTSFVRFLVDPRVGASGILQPLEPKSQTLKP